MKKMLALAAALTLSGVLLADCAEECAKRYEKCKDEVQKSGGFSYFKCLNERSECVKNCPIKK